MFLTPEMIRSDCLLVCLMHHIRQRRRAQWAANNAKRKALGYFTSYRSDNKEKIKSRIDKWEAENPDKVKARQSRYNLTPKSKERSHRYNKTEKAKLRKIRFKLLHPERVKEYDKRSKSTERYKALARARAKRNRPKLNEIGKRYQKLRYATDPQYRIMKHCRSRIRSAFKAQATKMSASASRLLGCTWAELRAHIESQFLHGMTWENYGYRGWHADHIKPIARFDLSDTEQVAQCFNFKNLRPLWGPENIRKGAKYEEPVTA